MATTVEVREGQYVLTVRPAGHCVEWAITYEPPSPAARRSRTIISGLARSEEEALRRGQLQLQALGVARERVRV
ncbi:MAG: hypothetical protein IMW98_02375 [Firmicutes bacterium]|nr:hypothetical protein [Bacillota bacterium]